MMTTTMVKYEEVYTLSFWQSYKHTRRHLLVLTLTSLSFLTEYKITKQLGDMNAAMPNFNKIRNC